MSESYDDDDYYDNLAEEWEPQAVGGGGGGAKKKKPKTPTTVGKRRIGGTQTWGSSDKVCAKNCTKKCCSGVAKNTPSL
jgi:hypothetical protein